MEQFESQVGYFSKPPGDIRWAHAVNSRARLHESLQDGRIDFLEIDVSMSVAGEPIAAHPPATDSDLLIADIAEITGDSPVGYKFDFKDSSAVVPVLEALSRTPSSRPIILNADILPTNPAKPVKIESVWFIETCQALFPGGLLSLGWRTDGTGRSTYTAEHVQQMLDICEDLSAVTFPIRASLLAASWENVQKLLEKSGRTLTLWNTGPLSTDQRKWIKLHTSPETCYYDIDLST
jgi:hypothetical protein